MVITMVTSTTRVAPKLRASSLRMEEWNNIDANQCSAGKPRIMDFELKTLDPAARSCAEKCDALMVLVRRELQARQGRRVGAGGPGAQGAATSRPRPASCCSAYRPRGHRGHRGWCWPAPATARAKQVRTAVQAAVAALRTTGVRSVLLSLLCLAGADDDAVRAAVLAMRRCQLRLHHHQVQARRPRSCSAWWWPWPTLASAARPASQAAPALSTGIELAREWANRPANHATPDAAGARRRKKLGQAARHPGARCWAPRKSPSSAWAPSWRWPRARSEPLRFIVLRYDGGGQDARRRWCWWARASPSTPAAFPSSRPPRWTR